MTPTRSRSLILAAVALLAAVVVTVLPTSVHRSALTWDPTSSEDGGTLNLTRGWAEKLSIESTCDRARAAAEVDSTLMTTGPGTLTLEEGRLSFGLTDAPRAEVELPSGGCDIRAGYDHGSQTVFVRAGDQTDSTSSDPLGINVLGTADPPGVAHVEVSTRGTGVYPSSTRWLIALLSVLAAGAAVVMASRAARRQNQPRARVSSRRPTAADLIVTTGALILATILPAQYDDGWVLARIRLLMDDQWFGNVYTVNNAWLPQGLPHESVLGGLQATGFEYVHLRVAMVLLVVAAWFVLTRCVLAPVIGEAVHRWPPVAAVYLAFVGAWLVTVRAEPVVVLLTAIAVAAGIYMRRNPRPLTLFVGLMASGIAVLSHQTGAACIGVVMLLLTDTVRACRSSRQDLPGYLSIVIASLALGLTVCFGFAGVQVVIEGAREFDQEQGRGVFGELSRYDWFGTGRIAGPRTFTLIILVFLAALSATRFGTATPDQRRTWNVACLLLAGLLVTPTKLPWHVGVAIIPATIFTALIVASLPPRATHSDASELTRDARALPGDAAPGYATLLIGTLLAAGMTMTLVASWGNQDVAAMSWQELSSAVMDDAPRRWWYLALLLVAVLGAFAARGRFLRTSSLVWALMLLTPLAMHSGWMIRDAAAPGWSPLGAQVRQLLGSDRCGVLENNPVITGATTWSEVAESEGPQSAGRDPLGADAYPRVQGLAGGPLGGTVSTWGTWSSTEADDSADANQGNFSTPQFRVESGELTFWFTSGVTEGISIDAVFSDGRAEIIRVPVDVEQGQHWMLREVAVPAEATLVRLEVDDATGAFGGWAALSAPVTPTTTPAEEVFLDASGFAGPFESTHYPCMRLPDSSTGAWGHIDYYVANGDNFFESDALYGLTTTQVACPTFGGCLAHLDYAMAAVERR